MEMGVREMAKMTKAQLKKHATLRAALNATSARRKTFKSLTTPRTQI
jgi:hypothetical protein